MATGDVTAKILSGPSDSSRGPVQLGTTSTTVVHADSVNQNPKTIKQIIICNTDGVERLVTLAINYATQPYALMYQLPIAASDTIVFDTALTLIPVLAPDLINWEGTIVGLCDAASVVTVTAVGWETEA